MPKKLILIVEDNPSHRTLMQELLNVSGFDNVSASSADDALKLIAENQPQMILMDIQLPGMNGLELTRKLKEDPLYKNIIIIAVTAYAMKFEKEAALKAGCNDYVTKPIDVVALPLLIKKYLNIET